MMYLKKYIELTFYFIGDLAFYVVLKTMFIFECQCQHFQIALSLGDYNKGLCNLFLTSSSELDDRTNFCKYFFLRYFTIHTIETITLKYDKVWAVMGLP